MRRLRTGGTRIRRNASEIEERGLLGGRDGLAPAGLGRALLSLLPARGVGGRGAREPPALLVGDALTLLDDEEVHEARERVREQAQVLLPITPPVPPPPPPSRPQPPPPPP